MLNLRKRIKNLQENTSSLEAKSICKEILENFVNLPESQISATLAEKLKSVEDSDKHVERFVKVAEKIEAVNNLGLVEAVKAIKESQIYGYPGLKYSLDKLETSLLFNKASGNGWNAVVMTKEGAMSNKPEYMLIDEALGFLKTFVWDGTVEKIYNGLKKKREELRESIDILIAMDNMKNNKGSFFFDSILPKLEEHFVNPNDASRTSIMEDLRKMNYYPAAKRLSESLAIVQKNSRGGVQIIAENGKCSVSSIYSPILLENGNEYFYAKGNFFAKAENEIKKITEEEVSALPEKFREVCRIISSPNVFIKEGKISFYLKRDKVEILENDSAVEVRFNGSKISKNDLAKKMVSAGLFRLEESQIAYDVQSIADSFENIFDVDFGKVIESNFHNGSFVILMKSGDNIYLNKVNESMKSNEFFSGMNATQARNQILEFIGFDIKESMSEYLEKDELEVNRLRESQVEIMKSLSIVEANLEKVNTAMKSEIYATSPEMVELKGTLESELVKLKNSHREAAEKIKAFENKSSDAGYEVGEEVKLTESGEVATVSSINSSRDTLIVVTSNGKTVEVPASKVSSMDSEIEKANAENAEKAAKEPAMSESSTEDDEEAKKKLI